MEICDFDLTPSAVAKKRSDLVPFSGLKMDAGDPFLKPEYQDMNWFTLMKYSSVPKLKLKLKPKRPALAPTGPQPPDVTPPVPSMKVPVAGKGHRRWTPPSRPS